MATWQDPKTTHTAEDQVTADLFNVLAENEVYLNDTKITTSQVQDATVSSTQATSRTNIGASETVKSAFGKIRKWFADLKAMAFKASVSTADIDSEAVTNAKIKSVAASKVTGLHAIATSGSYSDLEDVPSDVDLSPYIKKGDLLNYLYPVGSIRMSTSSTNPGNYLGGSWSLWGSGRVPVGVNTSDSDFSSVEKTGGEKAHQLLIGEIPYHSHSIDNQIGTNGYESNKIQYNYDMGTNGSAHIYNTGGAGGSGAHNNLQPYITCYMWKRTA